MRGLFRIGFALCVGASALTSTAAGQIGGIKVPKVPKVPTVPTAPAAPTTQAPAAQPAPADSTPSTAAQPAGAQAGAPATPAGPGQGAWVNYDFQPGEIPLYVDDFSRDRVGNFPKRLEFISGNMEVAEWNGVRFLRATTRSSFSIILPDTLTDRFTMEFDATGSIANIFTTVTFAPNAPSYAAFRYFNDRLQGGIDGTGPKALAMGKPSAFETPFRFRIMADGKYVKVYIDETRVANIPNADLGRSNKITIEFVGSEEKPAFVGNFSVLAGGRELYDALEENGRVATQGIYFDSGFRQDPAGIDADAGRNRRHAQGPSRSRPLDRGPHRQRRHPRLEPGALRPASRGGAASPGRHLQDRREPAHDRGIRGHRPGGPEHDARGAAAEPAGGVGEEIGS